MCSNYFGPKPSPVPISEEDISFYVDGRYIVRPDQAGNAGKFLSTDGSVVSWENVPETEFATQAEAEAGTNNDTAMIIRKDNKC